MSEKISKVGGFVSNHWSIIAACIAFLGTIWYTGKLHDYEIAELKTRITKIEALDERLRNIELGVMELKTMAKQNLHYPALPAGSP